MEFLITTFYKFALVEDADCLQESLIFHCKENNIKGTILIGDEGINGTVAGSAESIESFKSFLKSDFRFADMLFKDSYSKTPPFLKTKIKVKPEIVTLGKQDVDVANFVGEYVSPENWDQFIAGEDVILIDGRNDYEYHVGTFSGAVNTETENFRDFPQWVEENKSMLEGKKIATFCTGGIRCEKSTAFLKESGFNEVYHLEGGIINYFIKTGNKNKKWQGHCFVFDDRVAINDQLVAIGSSED